MDNLLEQLNQLADEAARTVGCQLVDLEVNRAKSSWVIRVFVEHPVDVKGGVTIEDCSQVSTMLSSLLDVHDPIPDRYTLEVSSPGALRPLKKREDYQKFAGRLAAVHTHLPPDPANGRRRFVGKIIGIEGDVVTLEVDGSAMGFGWDTIARANLELDIPAKGVKGKRPPGKKATDVPSANIGRASR